MDRLEQLKTWLETQQPGKNLQLIPLAGDASFRKYYRATNGRQSWVVMDADPIKEHNEAFLAVAEAFAMGGVLVPLIIARDRAKGFFLISDFGDTLLLDVLNQVTADELYSSAFDILLNIQQIKAPLPEFTADRFKTELLLFDDWYLQRLLRITLPSNELADLYAIYEMLVGVAISQPQVCIHRDFHSRNLMRLSDGEIGVLDFQDASIGPITYDLTSLLRDSYIDWPPEQVDLWKEQYFHKIQKAKLIENVSIAEFTCWFDWVGIQRHLKNLGVFSRLHLRDNKSEYLNYLPRMLKYLIDVSSKYDELTLLSQLLSRVTDNAKESVED